MHRPVSLRLFLIAAVFVLTPFAGEVQADDPFATQADAYDYFAARTAGLEQRLRSNETRHLYPGIQLLRSGSAAATTGAGHNKLQYARGEFDFVLNYWPNHPYALALMSETLIKLGQAGLIERYFDRAYDYSTKEAAPVYVAHGISLLQQGQTKRAIEKLTRAVELDADSRDAHYNLGLAYLRANNLTQANVHAQKAYALGHPLPGLRSQLMKAGAWKPAPPLTANAPSGAPGPQSSERTKE